MKQHSGSREKKMIEKEKIHKILDLCMRIREQNQHTVEFNFTNLGTVCTVLVKEKGLEQVGNMRIFSFFDIEILEKDDEEAYKNCVKYLQKLLKEKE